MGNKTVLVWGAGGHGKVTVDALMAGGEWEVAGILDEDDKKWGTVTFPCPPAPHTNTVLFPMQRLP